MKTVLIIEDDEISQAFMAQAIALLATNCLICNSFSEAHELCQNTAIDLIISDLNTADGSLFEHIKCLPVSCKMLAVSAEINANIIERLRKLGIHDVLAKPMSITALNQRVSHLLESNSTQQSVIWDTQKALQALGHNEQILTSLKQMFSVELPIMMSLIQQAFDKQQAEQIHEILHKLKASCGFLGANRLLQECSHLDADISEQNINRFMDVAKQTLALI
jgi:DNA-binding NtrC family response regulator